MVTFEGESVFLNDKIGGTPFMLQYMYIHTLEILIRLILWEQWSFVSLSHMYV